jgi:hypothetical protein
MLLRILLFHHQWPKLPKNFDLNNFNLPYPFTPKKVDLPQFLRIGFNVDRILTLFYDIRSECVSRLGGSKNIDELDKIRN